MTLLRCVALCLLSGIALLSVACTTSDEEIVKERIKEALSGLPTAIAIVFPTPLPTTTPIPTTTLPSTTTPVPTATPQPTATPMTIPPTPTAVTIPPTPTPRPVLSLSEVYRNTWPSVFFIETPSGHGSGWLIERGLILTNEHVVTGHPEVTVRQPEHQAFEVVVLAVDSLKDIALLQFDSDATKLHPGAEPLQLGHISSNNIAESVIGLGYSEGRIKSDGTVGSAAANVGVLSQVIDFGGSGAGLNLVLDAALDPGDSGGPILNSDGLVVGMARAARVRTGSGQRVVGTFFAVHIDEIRASLSMLKKGESR